MRAPSSDRDDYLEDVKDAAATLRTADRLKLARHVADINAKAPGLPAEVRQFFGKISDRYGREAASRLFKWVLQLNPVTESASRRNERARTILSATIDCANCARRRIAPNGNSPNDWLILLQSAAVGAFNRLHRSAVA